MEFRALLVGIFRRAACERFVILLLCVLLVACGEAPVEPAQNVGGPNPEAVTQSFIDDLNKALKDPQIQTDAVRSRWVNTLADYFAPTEREDQRDALALMLDNFVRELKSEVAPGEEFQIEIRQEGFRKIKEDDGRALVEIRNGRIYWQVLRDGYLIDEQETPLTQIIGRQDNALPSVRVGNSWYLTERY